MPTALDLTGQKFGALTAVSKAPSRSGKTYWLCRCECGNEKEVQTGHLTSGAIQSCGCKQHLKKNSGKNVVNFRKRIKLALVKGFSHKCSYCGLRDAPQLYDFHHVDPSTKSFGIANSSTTRSKQAYADEAKKCIMLCANCHRRIENGLISLDDFTPILFDEEKYFKTLEDLIS